MELRAGNRVLDFDPGPRSKTKLLANPRHTFRSLAPVLFGRVSVFREPLFVLLRESGKFLPQEWQELLGRRWHQEQHTREKPLGSRFFRRVSHGLQIPVA